MKIKKTMAVLVLCLMLGCTQSPPVYSEEQTTQPQNSDTPQIVWAYPGVADQKDLARVETEINKYVLPKIGATVKLKRIGWGDWYTSDRKNCDITFTANWFGFKKEAAAGEFLPLDSIMDTYLPRTKALLGTNLMKGASLGGSLYALPVIGENAVVAGVKLRKDLVTKYKINTASIKKVEDLEPALKIIKRNVKGINIMEVADTDFNNLLNLDLLGDYNLPGMIFNDSKDMKVLDVFSLPQTKAYFKVLYKYFKAGYLVNAKNPTGDEDQGKAFAILKGNMLPFDNRYTYTKPGLEWVNIPLGKPVLSSLGATWSMNAVSANSEYPDKALALLELVYTDKYLNNLLNYGIEKVHYIKNTANIIGFPKGQNVNNSKYYINSPWLFCNQYLNYTWSYEDPARITKIKALNAAALPSAGLGFSFDTSPIQSIVDECSSVYSQFITGFAKGLVDPEKELPSFRQKLDDAGALEILAEKQKQLDAWAGR